MRRAQPLDPSPLLIDENKDVLSPDDQLEICNERSNLLRIVDVAPEQNETARPFGGKKFALRDC